LIQKVEHNCCQNVLTQITPKHKICVLHHVGVCIILFPNRKIHVYNYNVKREICSSNTQRCKKMENEPLLCCQYININVKRYLWFNIHNINNIRNYWTNYKEFTFEKWI